MTRKDTLIIAVLVNCVLLIALFISALKRDTVEQEISANTREALKPVIEVPVTKVEIRTAQGDEVDKVLQDFSLQEESSHFAQELKALLPSPEEQVITPAAQGIEVTVRKGDALEKIARQHHTTVSEIIQSNGLTSTTLQIGQKLRILPKQEREPSTPSLQEEESSVYYTVISGDNPWTIAVKNRMKVDQLLRLNGLNEEKARQLKPGDRLRIR